LEGVTLQTATRVIAAVMKTTTMLLRLAPAKEQEKRRP